MKIATFNINNVNNALQPSCWLEAAKPDVVCLQELKATDSEFPAAAIEKAGYGAVWRDRSHGMALPSWRAIASRSSHTPRYPVIHAIPRAATSRRPSTAC